MPRSLGHHGSPHFPGNCDQNLVSRNAPGTSCCITEVCYRLYSYSCIEFRWRILFSLCGAVYSEGEKLSLAEPSYISVLELYNQGAIAIYAIISHLKFNCMQTFR